MFGCATYAHQIEGKLDPRTTKCIMLGYPEVVKGYRLWVLRVQGIKIINSRNVVFNESEMPCIKNEIDNSRMQNVETTSRSEVKLARLSPTQHTEAMVQQSNENVVNTDKGGVDLPQVEVETEMENPKTPTVETSTQDYQLVKDMEMRQVNPNPRYEINALISGES